jgi:uncharacterized protein YjbI with pentapeptide repeats
MNASELIAKYDAGERDFRRADLSGANLRRANLSGADLYGANLSGADLSDAILHRADLRGANLRGADLHRANLYGANLSGADLSDANLHRANLGRADLSGANLVGAQGILRIGPALHNGREIYAYWREGETFIKAGCFDSNKSTLAAFKQRVEAQTETSAEGAAYYQSMFPLLDYFASRNPTTKPNEIEPEVTAIHPEGEN